MTDKELLQQALEWVEWFASDDHSVRPTSKARETAEAIKTRLAQPEPEFVEYDVNGATVYIKPPLYTAPPKKEWVGLTDYEIVGIASLNQSNDFSFARAIEAKLKEKNSGNHKRD